MKFIPLIIFTLLSSTVVFSQDKNEKLYPNVRVIEREKDTITKITIYNKDVKGSVSQFEYIHSIGFLFGSTYNDFGYADFSYDLNYESRFNFLNSGNVVSFGLLLRNAVGISTLRLNNPFFNYQAIAGPNVSFGLASSSNSKASFGASITPAIGFNFMPALTNATILSYGGNINLMFDAERVFGVNLFYLRDFDNTNKFNVFGLTVNYYLENY